ncbi:S1 family peptidase [Streptomyces sp. DT18]
MAHRARALLLTALALLTGGTLAAPPASAVIGGAPSTYGPWAVRMFVDGVPTCTGTAVAREWVLSASHCFFEQGQAVADKRISFRVGSLDATAGTLVHPVKGARRGSAEADMMLVKVPPMTVRTAPLASEGVHTGQRVRVYGWGATCEGDENACQSRVLKEADLRVVRPDDPRCAGHAGPGTSDFCMEKVKGIPAGGDSGGPVMSVAPHGREKLVGVFDGSDRESTAEAGEIARQRKWLRGFIG